MKIEMCGTRRPSVVLAAVLSPLLVALWGARVHAVTLEGPCAVRAAARCATAVQGFPLRPSLAPEAGCVRTADGEPSDVVVGSEALAWAEPDLSKGAILRLARTAAWEGASGPEVVVPREDWRTVARAVFREPKPMAAPEVSVSPAPSAMAEGVVLRGVGSHAAPRPRRRVASDAASVTRMSVRWWHPLPLLPGLLALAVSVRGMVRAEPREALVRC
jgi:hypothetical protein